jgi:DNA primase
MANTNLLEIKAIPILDVARQLGIKVHGNKAMCFNGHDNKTPSLSFSKDKNLWKCFGCDNGGDNISLVMGIHQCDFKTALEWFSQVYNLRVSFNSSYRHRKIPLRKHSLYNKQVEKSSSVSSTFSVDSEIYSWLHNVSCKITNHIGINYLRNHGISDKIAYEYGIRELVDPRNTFQLLVGKWNLKRIFQSGISWGNNGIPECLIWSTYCLIFPFYEEDKIIYLQGRLFNKEPKYLNLRGIQKPLYNSSCLNKIPKGSTIHICEGIPDVLALATKGIPAVGVLGASSFRNEWVDYFLPFDIVLLPDGDKGGETFKHKIGKLFCERGKTMHSVWLPPGKDVSDVIAEMDGTN